MNNVLHLVICTRCCNTPLATAIYDSGQLRTNQNWLINTPSNVEVPLPSSSRITNDLPVARCRISLVSCISTINVECPRVSSSEAVDSDFTSMEGRIGIGTLELLTSHPCQDTIKHGHSHRFCWDITPYLSHLYHR